MIKYFCDICHTEISEGQDNGIFEFPKGVLVKKQFQQMMVNLLLLKFSE